MTKRIAIIAGAGPAGLTAAYELLTRTDIKPIVYEATNAIGGIAQTYNYKGNRIDIGGHRFWTKSGRVMDWWFAMMPVQGAPAADTQELKHEIDYSQGGPDPEKEDKVMLQRPRLSRIFYQRSFFPYPISITFSIALKLGIINTILIGFSYLWTRAFPAKDETYLDAFLTNRFGKRLYNTFFKDYTEKVWGVKCSEIKADWGAQRIKGLSLRRALVQALKDLVTSDAARKQKERETSLITRFYYPKFGPGQMWELTVDRIRELGGEVHMKKKVIGVQLEHDHSENEGSNTEHRTPNTEHVSSITIEDVEVGSKETVQCDYFFSTMPIKHLMPMMTPSPPSDVLRVAQGLVYRDFITVGLLLKELHVKEGGKDPQAMVPDNWIYVQERDVTVGRIQIFNNWSPYMVEDRKGTVWIGLEYFVNEGDEIWNKSDEDMKEFGISEMVKIDFIRREDVLDGCVLRMPKTYPAYFGTYDDLDIVREYVNRIPNLFLVGRNGMHRYNNQDHSMLSAMVAVDNIEEGNTDNSNLWQVNAEEEYLEEKK
jgi:protoporphyrinogen oxidase